MTSTIVRIQHETAARFGMPPGVMSRRATIATVIEVRRIAAYFCMVWSGAPVPEIARAFGMADPFWPVDCALEIFDRCRTEPALRATLRAIEDRLELAGAIACRDCPRRAPGRCDRCGATTGSRPC